MRTRTMPAATVLLLAAFVAAGKDGPWELYNLEADGTETQDVKDRHPERVRDLAARWKDWAKRSGLAGSD